LKRILALLLSTAVVLAVLTASPSAAQQNKVFTIEQILSPPFPSSLAASKEGKVAWVLTAKGVRNIWVAEPPSYKGRQLTSYSADDGEEIGELVWTNDDRGVIYTRGGDQEGFGENPNPQSLPAEPKQLIWLINLDGKPSQQLAEGHSAALAPTGNQLVYIKGRDIWTAKTEGSEKPSLLIQAKGRSSSLRWSPDGRKLAFTNARGDHAFVGVYDLASKAVTYLEPSVDRDSEPVWSPNSKELAFIRTPADREAFAFRPRRTAAPWSIWIADVDTGNARQVWKADEGRGSAFRGIVADDQLLWSADNRIIFPWEKDGWTHLYSIGVSSTSEKPTLLTPGEFEVEHVAISKNGKEVLFSSNQNDIDRRHIWRVLTTGGSAPVAVTSGSGIEWAPLAMGDGKAVAFFRSDWHRPSRAAIIIGSGNPQDLAPDGIPTEFPDTALVEPQQVIFNGADGLKIHGQLFLPSNMDRSKRYPALLFFHGGSRRQMLLGWHYMYYYRNAYALNQYLANHGYVVLSVNYRSGIGYGLDFREALNYGATGASEFNDVLGAGLYLRGRPDVDPSRIGLWGGSYGGYLTAMGLARASDLFAAGVDMHGVHDWNSVIRNFVPAYDPAARPEAARLAFESSPLASVKTWRSPVLLVHGDDDRNVPFSETVHLVEALRSQRVDLEQLIFPDEIHDFLRYSDWIRAYRASADFLDRHLKK